MPDKFNLAEKFALFSETDAEFTAPGGVTV
jgi:hypothetical protein